MKSYPLRTKESELYNICNCGHGDYYHSQYDKSSNLIGTACEQCTCPKYEFEQKLNMSDLIKLEDKINQTSIRSGFTT